MCTYAAVCCALVVVVVYDDVIRSMIDSTAADVADQTRFKSHSIDH